MNSQVINNYAKLKPASFLLPLLLLLTVVVFLYTHGGLHADNYVQVQKDFFYFINHHLGKYPNLMFNLTQLGDASIILSFLTIFIVYAPKIWEALVSASLVSLIFSSALKNLFSIPRPAVALDADTFIIVGRKAVGFASLPSGHSITIFTTFIVLLFAFMPRKLIGKMLWCLLIVLAGLAVAASRVGVGAHYPLDVTIGSIIGYISALIGIFISRRFAIWGWIGNKKYYPVFMVLIVACAVSIIIKMTDDNLLVYWLALASLIVPFYKMCYAVFKK